MSRQAQCRDCGGDIEFEKKYGKWVPLDVNTRERHICDLRQKCTSCQQVFRGANWMEECPACFKSRRDAEQEFNRPKTGIEASTAHNREVLKDDGNSNDPF